MTNTSAAHLGRLLIVDDETTLVTALLSTLRDSGYTAVGAANPLEALDILGRERFDVLLTDLHLPDMDGVELLRRALVIDPTLSVVMMTGHGSINSAVDAMKAGAMDYILKPFSLKAALAALARVLEVRVLRQANEALNLRLVARTRELETVNAELEAFSYSVSHDLRAPLRSIRGYTEALVEEYGREEKQAQDYGQRITGGVRRMERMIEDLLRLAKAMRSEIEQSDVDLSQLAAEIMAKLQAEEPDRKLELIIAPNLKVVGDPGLLRMAMENLLGNAWKYTTRLDAAVIEVGMRASPEGPVYFVRDNGVGFDPVEASKLFAPFQRLSSAKNFEGTGVGLTTVKRIVHRHGGAIWAEGEPGKGATFFWTMLQEKRP